MQKDVRHQPLEFGPPGNITSAGAGSSHCNGGKHTLFLCTLKRNFVTRKVYPKHGRKQFSLNKSTVASLGCEPFIIYPLILKFDVMYYDDYKATKLGKCYGSVTSCGVSSLANMYSGNYSCICLLARWLRCSCVYYNVNNTLISGYRYTYIRTWPLW